MGVGERLERSLNIHFFMKISWKSRILFVFCLKFNNLGLALRMALKFYTSVTKELKIKTKKVLVVISLTVEVAGENKENGGPFVPLSLRSSS